MFVTPWNCMQHTHTHSWHMTRIEAEMKCFVCCVVFSFIVRWINIYGIVHAMWCARCELLANIIKWFVLSDGNQLFYVPVSHVMMASCHRKSIKAIYQTKSKYTDHDASAIAYAHRPRKSDASSNPIALHSKWYVPTFYIFRITPSHCIKQSSRHRRASEIKIREMLSLILLLS